jgi:hypothetical protein
MRVLKHLALCLVCTGAALVFGYCGVAIGLDGFAVGGDVELSEQQKRNGATGDAMLEVFDWPSKHLLGVHHSWAFSSVFFGAVLYGTLVALHRCRRAAVQLAASHGRSH